MSTRSAIGMRRADGKIEAIYCHFDGYPDGVGRILARSYRDPQCVKALLALRELSSLGDDISTCCAYTDSTATSAVFDNEYLYADGCCQRWGVEYVYLYDSGNWFYASCSDGNFEVM